jgi:hypothetical protein
MLNTSNETHVRINKFGENNVPDKQTQSSNVGATPMIRTIKLTFSKCEHNRYSLYNVQRALVVILRQKHTRSYFLSVIECLRQRILPSWRVVLNPKHRQSNAPGIIFIVSVPTHYSILCELVFHDVYKSYTPCLSI